MNASQFYKKISRKKMFVHFKNIKETIMSLLQVSVAAGRTISLFISMNDVLPLALNVIFYFRASKQG